MTNVFQLVLLNIGRIVGNSHMYLHFCIVGLAEHVNVKRLSYSLSGFLTKS